MTTIEAKLSHCGYRSFLQKVQFITILQKVKNLRYGTAGATQPHLILRTVFDMDQSEPDDNLVNLLGSDSFTIENWQLLFDELYFCFDHYDLNEIIDSVVQPSNKDQNTFKSITRRFGEEIALETLCRIMTELDMFQKSALGNTTFQNTVFNMALDNHDLLFHTVLTWLCGTKKISQLTISKCLGLLHEHFVSRELCQVESESYTALLMLMLYSRYCDINFEDAFNASTKLTFSHYIMHSTKVVTEDQTTKSSVDFPRVLDLLFQHLRMVESSHSAYYLISAFSKVKSIRYVVNSLNSTDTTQLLTQMFAIVSSNNNYDKYLQIVTPCEYKAIEPSLYELLRMAMDNHYLEPIKVPSNRSMTDLLTIIQAEQLSFDDILYAKNTLDQDKGGQISAVKLAESRLSGHTIEKMTTHLRRSRLSEIDIVQHDPVSNMDCMLENNFVLDQALNSIGQQLAENVLIINPSYLFVREWVTSLLTQPTASTIVLLSSEAVKLLKRSKDISSRMNIKIQTMDEFKTQTKNTCLYDLTLIFARNLASDLFADCLDALATNKAGHSKCLAVIPDNFLSDSTLLAMLFKNGYALSKVLLFPSESTKSTPRKKIILETVTYPNVPYIELNSLDYRDPGSTTSNFLVYGKAVSLPRNALPLTTTTIRQTIKALRKDPAQQTYEKAKIFQFSKEISFSYSVYFTTEKAKFCAEVSLSSPKDSSSSNRKNEREIRHKKVIVKYTSAQETDLISRIYNEAPRNDKLRLPAIKLIRQLLNSGNLGDVSLKTAWYCNQEDIRSYAANYDDNLAQGMMESFGDIMLGSINKDSIESLMNDYFITMKYPRNTQRKYWYTLKAIIDVVHQNGYFLHGNPFARFDFNSNYRTNEDVYSALTKPCFCSEEKVKFYAEMDAAAIRADRKSLLLLIRYETGMRLNEITALVWKDIIKIPYLPVTHLVVSKTITRNGKYESFFESYKYRKIPISSRLSDYLKMLRRIAQSLNRGEDISNFPILTGDTRMRQIVTISELKKISNTFLKGFLSGNTIQLPFDDKTKQIDLNHTTRDLFRSNFRWMAKHVCQLKEGQVDYLLGTAQQSTLGEHYSDYGNNLQQTQIRIQLDRWQKNPTSSPIEPYQESIVLKKGRKGVHRFNGINAGRTFGKILIGPISKDEPVTLKLTANSPVPITIRYTKLSTSSARTRKAK